MSIPKEASAMNGAGNEVFGLCRGCRNDVKAKQPSLYTEKKKKETIYNNEEFDPGSG